MKNKKLILIIASAVVLVALLSGSVALAVSGDFPLFSMKQEVVEEEPASTEPPEESEAPTPPPSSPEIEIPSKEASSKESPAGLVSRANANDDYFVPGCKYTKKSGRSAEEIEELMKDSMKGTYLSYIKVFIKKEYWKDGWKISDFPEIKGIKDISWTPPNWLFLTDVL